MALRIALFTLDSPLSREATAALLQAHAPDIVLIGQSDPCRAAAGGRLGQLHRHWRRSGPRLLPWLARNYGLPTGQLARMARRFGLPLHRIGDINGDTTAALLRAARPDVIVSLHCDQILAEATLALAPLGGINIHPSLLPRHRGPMPVFWAMQEEPPATGASIHRMVPRIDAGAVLAQQQVALPAGTSVAAATRQLHRAGVALLPAVLARLEAGAAEPSLPETLPYCPFPDAVALRGAARRGLRLLG